MLRLSEDSEEKRCNISDNKRAHGKPCALSFSKNLFTIKKWFGLFYLIDR